ncbi:MAG: glycosyl transferase family 1 [Candidatus Aenigmarchaeota archaeon ex4484_56]|nr:MAG: glycosyl transferase family 1 [Candidatus Aenigmarchaeota archaeon ex4484_56]
MRIAYFVWEYPPKLVGGLGTYASQMVPRIAKYGNRVTVFTLNDGTLPTSEFYENIEIHRPKIIDAVEIMNLIVDENLKSWGTYLGFFNQIFSYNYLSAAKFLNELQKNEKYDLVVVHDWLSAIAGIIIKRNTDIPLVAHFHSTEQQRVGDGCKTIKQLEGKLAQTADMIITVSYAMRDHLISLGYPQEKINVVWNGCDVDKYNLDKVNWDLVNKLRERYNIKYEKIILFIGRLTWIKGVENLILGFPYVLKEFPNTKLIILGKGEEYNDIIDIIERLNIKDKVIVRSEFVSEEERIAHYALADICVFPSFSEPFGIVSLEAMALKKPVVVGASGISGFREQVIPSGEEQTGYHVDGKRPEDIAWGIKELLRHPEKAKRLGENGRKRVETIFNLDKVASNTLFLYKKVIS